MNVLQRTILEVKIGDKFYNFECMPDSSLMEVNQALVTMNNYVLSKIEEAKPKEEEKIEVVDGDQQ